MIKWINTAVLPLWLYTELTSVVEIFWRAFGRSSKILKVQRAVALFVFWWIKIENRDVTVHIAESFEGETYVTEKAVLTLEYNLPMNQTEPCEKIEQREITYFNFISNANNVKIFDLLAFLVKLLSSFCFHVKTACRGGVNF